MTDLQMLRRDEFTGEVTFKVESRTVDGFDKLVQMVVFSLLNNPGRDALSPELGSGIPALIGSNIDPEDPVEAFGEIAIRISKTETEIINSQLDLDLAQEERLAQIQILSIQEGESVDEVLVRIRVINEEGRRADIVV